MNEAHQSERLEGLDLIRTLAIILVIFIHCMTPGFDKLEFIDSLSGFTKVFHFTWFSIGRIGVPLFLYLSGYLLLSRNYDEDKTKRFYKHNFFTLLLTWQIWILIYNICQIYFEQHPFSWSVYIKNALFLQHCSVFHAWYMEVILGIYLFIPFISRTLHNMNDREILTLTAISFIYLFVVPTLNHFTSTPKYSPLDLSFSGGMYGFYLIVGYLIKRFEVKFHGISKVNTLILVLITISMATVAQIYGSADGRIYHLWYDFCLLPVTSLLIFISLKDLHLKKFSNLITTISKYSFGIYLVHVIFPVTMFKFNLLNFISTNELRMITAFIATAILSLPTAMLLRKIPRLGNILIR